MKYQAPKIIRSLLTENPSAYLNIILKQLPVKSNSVKHETVINMMQYIIDTWEIGINWKIIILFLNSQWSTFRF